MNTQVTGGRMNILIAVLIVGLGLGGVALAQRSSGSNSVTVTILDGKIKVSSNTFTPGKLTLVAVNHGSVSHALAIMGTHLQAKRTPTLGAGKTAQLTVTVTAGMYHVWDPVTSSMSHATTLTVKAANATSTGTKSSSTSGTGSTSSGGATSIRSTGGGLSGTGGTATTPDDPCAGHMM